MSEQVGGWVDGWDSEQIKLIGREVLYLFHFQAFQVIKLFLGKLEKLSEDPEAAAQQQKTEG